MVRRWIRAFAVLGLSLLVVNCNPDSQSGSIILSDSVDPNVFTVDNPFDRFSALEGELAKAQFGCVFDVFRSTGESPDSVLVGVTCNEGEPFDSGFDPATDATISDFKGIQDLFEKMEEEASVLANQEDLDKESLTIVLGKMRILKNKGMSQQVKSLITILESDRDDRDDLLEVYFSLRDNLASLGVSMMREGTRMTYVVDRSGVEPRGSSRMIYLEKVERATKNYIDLLEKLKGNRFLTFRNHGIPDVEAVIDFLDEQVTPMFDDMEFWGTPMNPRSPVISKVGIVHPRQIDIPTVCRYALNEAILKSQGSIENRKKYLGALSWNCP